ncbi:MAG: hypothetical protein ABSE46_03240 [Terracidiphilus sp.]
MKVRKQQERIQKSKARRQAGLFPAQISAGPCAKCNALPLAEELYFGRALYQGMALAVPIKADKKDVGFSPCGLSLNLDLKSCSVLDTASCSSLSALLAHLLRESPLFACGEGISVSPLRKSRKPPVEQQHDVKGHPPRCKQSQFCTLQVQVFALIEDLFDLAVVIENVLSVFYLRCGGTTLYEEQQQVNKEEEPNPLDGRNHPLRSAF